MLDKISCILGYQGISLLKENIFNANGDGMSEENEFALKIARWTISNMQSEKGHFYYQKFRLHFHF